MIAAAQEAWLLEAKITQLQFLKLCVMSWSSVFWMGRRPNVQGFSAERSTKCYCKNFFKHDLFQKIFSGLPR